MNRDEQVGVAAARHLDALAQRDEHVEIAYQFGAEAFLPVDAPRQILRDEQRDILFPLAPGAQRTGVLAAMPGVYHHQHVALTARRRPDPRA